MSHEHSPALRPNEREFVGLLRQKTVEAHAHHLTKTLDQGLESVRMLAKAVGAYPSPLDTQMLGERERNIRTLLDSLTQTTSFSIELAIPTRASVAHSLTIARLNFFRMLVHAIRQLPSTVQGRAQMLQQADEFVAECIGLRATDEILRSIVCHKEEEHLLRERAALILLNLWHDIAAVDLGEVLPVLSATWKARRRVQVAFGTMMGASELFSLMAEGCDPQFIDFLTRPDCTPEEIQAFHEFLFGLSTEEMQAIQESGTSIVTPQKLVEKGLLRVSQLTSICQAGEEAENFYLFFMKRHILAINRAEMHLPGPHKTAEQYVLSHLLLNHWDAVNVW